MKYLFLAILANQPTHGYELLQIYERMFADVLPSLNAGQIYTTLSRLERDGLVHHQSVEQENKPDKRVYHLSDLGQQVLQEWLNESVSGTRIKDTFYLKLISAKLTGFKSPTELIMNQRQSYLQALHDLNLLSLQPEITRDPAKQVLIQGAVLHLKADLEWLTYCEEVFS